MEWYFEDYTPLTSIILKIPLRFCNSKPRRSLTWDVKTCTAAPVVKPLTKVSDSREEMTPSRRQYIAIWKHFKIYFTFSNLSPPKSNIFIYVSITFHKKCLLNKLSVISLSFIIVVLFYSLIFYYNQNYVMFQIFNYYDKKSIILCIFYWKQFSNVITN